MERLTKVEIEAIRKRAEAATEGPWKVYDEYCDTVEREEDGECIARIASRDKRNDDMEFIAHARTDIPKLLAEIDRLRGQLSEAREYNEYYFDLCKERKREIERLKYALEVIANSDGWLIEPAPLCTIEEAYERCVDTATKAIYGGDSE